MRWDPTPLSLDDIMGRAPSSRLAAGLGVLLLLPALAAAQDTRTIEPADYYRVQGLGSPALSPDGRHLLYTVQTVRRSENDRITHIWWTDLGSGRSQRLSTQGVNSTNPSWTPDGRRVYFSTSRGNESGVHFLNFAEPGGEAYRIPGLTGGFTFHPSGEWALVTRQVRAEGAPDPEPPSAEARARAAEAAQARSCWPSGPPAFTSATDPATRGRTEAERQCDIYVIEHSVYKRDDTFTFIPPGGGGGGGAWGGGGGGGGNDTFTQFFRVPADGLRDGEEAVQITHDEVNKSFSEFSRDGRWIVYTVNHRQAELEDENTPAPDPEFRHEDAEPSDSIPPETGIYRVSSQGGEPELLHRVRGSIRGVTLSPDGNRVAFVKTAAGRTDPWIRVVDVRNGNQVDMAREDWIYSVGNPIWSQDGRDLLFTSAVRGTDQVVKVAAAGGPVQFVTEGRHTFSGSDLNVARGLMAYVRTTPEEPWEAWVANLDGSGARQVTTVNADWMRQVRLSEVEYFTYEGVPHNREWLNQLPEQGVEWMLENDAPEGDAFEVDAWLVYPVDYEPGRQYPLVVYIHGGPHSRYADTWFPEFQMLAAKGMFVLYTNPRGSSGYGMHFQFSTLRAWGIDDYKDILQAVDLVVDRGVVDPERLGVTGGSYGGFMTNWITAHDQRFATAVTDRSITNWLSFYGVSDASGLVEAEFGGMPWPFQSADEGSYNLVMMLSPIVWADRVQTPTMIIHSINDYRTPLEGGEQWFRALQKHDVPVRMVLFPDSAHGLSRTGEPWLLVRRLQEYVDWFTGYLVDDEPVVASN
jgi:dipeptidyl aminopeptidase/acylaminoacyl peptidase